MALFLPFLLGFFVLFVSLSLFLLFFNTQQKVKGNLPPGHTGLPLIGETWHFISAGKKGHPEKFIYDRIAKYSSFVFKTHLLGSPAVVIGGLSGTKFLFSNENKLVKMWFPKSLEKILVSSSSDKLLKEEVTTLKRSMHRFLMPEVLQQYIGIMDQITQRELDSHWVNKDEVKVYPLAKRYTFRLACRLFLSMEDPNHVDKFEKPFCDLVDGLMSIPIDLPGTKMNRGIKAANFIRKELLAIMKQRKTDIAQGMASPTQDILSHMLSTTDEEGKFLPEIDIADKIMGLLFAGHDTLSSSCTSVVRFLAEYPQVYQRVYTEQMKIGNSKAEGELLNWEDFRSMTYSSNVVSEVLRLAPPAQGGFRESITDFMYNGYTIPKGYKVYWSAQSTHRNPEHFPDPLKFDPSRFDGSGPVPFTFVPFGGGPRICPGRDYARMGILTFMHHVVRRFKWERVIPDEKFIINPTMRPENGLPIRLYPHKKSQD